jgi:uncharacterized membrane protein YfcA
MARSDAHRERNLAMSEWMIFILIGLGAGVISGMFGVGGDW